MADNKFAKKPLVIKAKTAAAPEATPAPKAKKEVVVAAKETKTPLQKMAAKATKEPETAPKAVKAPVEKERASRARFALDASIKRTDGNPFREGSARSELLELAIKSKTVNDYLEAAGRPTGGTALSYLHIFAQRGLVSVG